jgi:hypothetical protein
MALLHIPLDQIDEARLQALIVAGAAESRIIDYKRTTYGSAHSDYSELLADISSFANMAGGDLILGVISTQYAQARNADLATVRFEPQARHCLRDRAHHWAQLRPACRVDQK